MKLSDIEGKMRDEEEKLQRKKDKKVLNKLKEKDLPSIVEKEKKKLESIFEGKS
jgi:hypothetical protein